MVSYIYAIVPNKLTGNSSILKDGGLIWSNLFTYVVDRMYKISAVQSIRQSVHYLSAIFYTIDRFSAEVQNIFLLNPVYLFIRYFRKIVIEATIPSPQYHLLMALDVLIVLGIGGWMYKTYNHRFLYYV